VEVPPERKGSWNRKHLLMIGGAVGAGFVALYFLLYLSKPPVESITVSPKSEESLPPLPSPQTAAISSVPEKEPLSLQLKAVEKTWVSVEVDDQPEKEMLLRPGEGASYQGQKRIFLIIGNAGGLDLIFNGRPLERFGTSGEVVTLTVVPEGVEAKRHEKPKTP
jgi:hypothetical protein